MLFDVFESVLRNSVESYENFLQMWQDIVVAYSKKERHYHNLEHIDFVVNLLLEKKDIINDITSTLLSAFYHDYVYDTKQKDNELKSAEYVYNKLVLIGFEIEKAKKCYDMIIATKEHNQSLCSDTNYLTDADLAILGQDRDIYCNYADCIRKEYYFVENYVYNRERIKVLDFFLKKKFIFKTFDFREKYELKARENIANEIEMLKNNLQKI